MSPEQRQAARERCDKATPGKWHYWTTEVLADWKDDSAGKATAAFIEGWTAYPDPETVHLCVADADFVVHARTDLPAALDYIAALEQQLAEVRQQLHETQERLVREDFRGSALEQQRDKLLAALRNMMDVQDCTTDCWCSEYGDGDDEPLCEACAARAAIASVEEKP